MKYLITGCQRSGTRFYAKYLSELFHWKFIDENDYEVHDYENLKKLLKDYYFCVIHAPALKHLVELFKKDYPVSQVIWMYRDTIETEESMKKINWNETQIELDKISKIIPINKFSNPFQDVIKNSLLLGKHFKKLGFVDNLIDMKTIENLKGFKKNVGVNGLK